VTKPSYPHPRPRTRPSCTPAAPAVRCPRSISVPGRTSSRADLRPHSKRKAVDLQASSRACLDKSRRRRGARIDVSMRGMMFRGFFFFFFSFFLLLGGFVFWIPTLWIHHLIYFSFFVFVFFLPVCVGGMDGWMDGWMDIRDKWKSCDKCDTTRGYISPELILMSRLHGWLFGEPHVHVRGAAKQRG